jgi:UDP-N-acetylmuramoyl-L-alanyl-D-glutamate--2,6-diaminopimelate ligase
MKELIKQAMGPSLLSWIRPFGHGIKGYLASLYYGFPATKLKIIAITGTKGKTSTVVTTGRLLNNLGFKTGYISTALFCIGGEEIINNTKMSSIDGIAMQKLLSQMVKNKCEYLVIEMSSQGLEQNRDKGLYGFDLAMFLNIYPEHIEAHGSFEKYLNAKAGIFKIVKKNGTAVVTSQPEFAESVDKIKKNYIKATNRLITIDNTVFQVKGDRNSQFKSLVLNNNIYGTNFMADFEVENLAFAIKSIEAVTLDQTIYSRLPQALNKLQGIPGRLEYVVKKNTILSTKEHKERPAIIDIMVDYAHETGSMEKLLQNMVDWKKAGYYDRIIHILSCDGVGRDDWKKPALGDISQKYADFTIVTTDNYDSSDNPDKIIEMITQNYDKSGLNITYTTEIKRKEAMTKSIHKANEYKGEKVIIVSTGVGTEQYLTQPEGLMRWDERLIWEMIFANFI